MSTTTAPTEALRYAASRLNHIEAERIRRINTFMSIARKEQGVTSNKEISDEDLKNLVDGWLGGSGSDFGLKLNDPLMDQLEKTAVKSIEREVKESPFLPFVEARLGIGLKSFGRLYAVIGDPIHLPDGEDRSLGQLFQYSCVGDPGMSRRKAGQRIGGNLKVGPRLHNIAETAGVKCNGKPYYRDVYDEAKAAKEGWLHTAPCAQCGTKSDKAKAEQAEVDRELGAGVVRIKNDMKADEGTPWRQGHIAAHGLRMVKRALLRDLYEEALTI